jgi:hypothetical protein
VAGASGEASSRRRQWQWWRALGLARGTRYEGPFIVQRVEQDARHFTTKQEEGKGGTRPRSAAAWRAARQGPARARSANGAWRARDPASNYSGGMLPRGSGAPGGAGSAWWGSGCRGWQGATRQRARGCARCSQAGATSPRAFQLTLFDCHYLQKFELKSTQR